MRTQRLKLAIFDLFPDTDHPIRSIIGKIAAGQPIEIIGEEELVDLNYLLTKGSRNVRLMLVEGDSMHDRIKDGDWVLVAMDQQPMPNDIVIARLNGGYTIKNFKLNDARGREGLYLVPSNGQHKTKKLGPKDDYSIVGVVLHIIKRAR